MRMIFALPLLALGLAACDTVPRGQYGLEASGRAEPAPYPASTSQREAEYRAIGTEPFWDLTIGHDMVFTDRGTGVSTVEQAAPIQLGASGAFYRGGQIDVDIRHQSCSDGMSDRVYPDSVRVTVEGRPYRGCGADAVFFAQRDNGVAGDIASAFVGRWSAVAINGKSAQPAERFTLAVTSTMVRTEGVCNDLRGAYRIVERRLMPDGFPWPRTERGCDPKRMALEDRVFAAMSNGPAISFPAPDRLRLANALGSIEFERAR